MAGKTIEEAEREALMAEIKRITEDQRGAFRMVVAEHNGLLYVVGFPIKDHPLWAHHLEDAEKFYVWEQHNSHSMGSWESRDALPKWTKDHPAFYVPLFPEEEVFGQEEIDAALEFIEEGGMK